MHYKAKHYFSFASHSSFGSGLRAWTKILYRNKFSVHPFFIPKVLFITSAIILSTPLRWYERIKFKKKILQTEIKNPVFIIGHPRSGTTFLHYLISKDPAFGFCATYQAMIPHIFFTASGFFNSIISKALPTIRPMDNLRMGTLLPKEEEFALAAYGPESMVTGYLFPKHFLKIFSDSVTFKNRNSDSEKNWRSNFNYFLRKLTVAEKGKKLLLKSPANTARVKQILSLYPEAKFIHIYRNPFDVYQSYFHLFHRLLPMLSFQQITDEAIEELIFASYTEMYQTYFKDKVLIPQQNLVEIKYEDFITDPLSHLEKIYSGIQLEGFDDARPFIKKELETYNNYQRNEFTLSKKLETKIAERWKFAFNEFGYETKFNRA